MRARGLLDPARRQQLPTLPAPALEVELPEPGDGVGGGVKPREAQLVAGAVTLPADVRDPQRLEQPGPQVVDQRPAAAALHQPGEGVGARLVVGEQRTGLGVGGDPRDGLVGMTAGHRRDVAHLHGAAAWIGDVAVQLGEVAEHRVVQAEQTLVDGERDGGRGEALAEGVQQVGAVGRVGRPPALGHHPAVTQQHEAVRLDLRSRLERGDEGQYAVRVDPLGSGTGQGQRGRGHPATVSALPDLRPVVSAQRPAPTRWTPPPLCLAEYMAASAARSHCSTSPVGSPPGTVSVQGA